MYLSSGLQKCMKWDIIVIGMQKIYSRKSPFELALCQTYTFNHFVWDIIHIYIFLNCNKNAMHAICVHATAKPRNTTRWMLIMANKFIFNIHMSLKTWDLRDPFQCIMICCYDKSNMQTAYCISIWLKCMQVIIFVLIIEKLVLLQQQKQQNKII